MSTTSILRVVQVDTLDQSLASQLAVMYKSCSDGEHRNFPSLADKCGVKHLRNEGQTLMICIVFILLLVVQVCFAYCPLTDPTSLNFQPTLWFILLGSTFRFLLYFPVPQPHPHQLLLS